MLRVFCVRCDEYEYKHPIVRFHEGKLFMLLDRNIGLHR
jgi:hypothetical protein